MSVISQPPTIDAFKAAVGSFASGITVLTVADRDRQPVGMTATAFTSVSTDPLLVLICVNKGSRTFNDILRNGFYGVNLLSRGSEEVSQYCSAPGTDKRLPSEWLLDAGRSWSAPALKSSVAFLDCEVYRHFPAGTHEVIIGKVCGIGLPHEDDGPVEPLLHFRSRYRQLDEHAAVTSS
jgi:flavin reductase (DIM6/NTAB) family NADH-FMN oxidoreductase RutF